MLDDIYSLIRPLLFTLDPETSHDWTLRLLSWVGKLPAGLLAPTHRSKPIHCFGLTFPNAVGLAAGLDKNAECVPAWQALGFGFVEVGTVTPRPQLGNPKPRLCRLIEQDAIINRMGFNNVGVDHVVEKLRSLKRFCPIGINIGKNWDTPLEQAAQDYQICFEKAYPMADYITVNISSPNTPGLRTLQQSEWLKEIVEPLMEVRRRLSEQFTKNVPILVKISPDLNSEEIAAIVKQLIGLKVDGIIATNTTAHEGGGLSGAPLRERATRVVESIHRMARGDLPIIAVGGIFTAEHAKEKLEAGAKLVQIYTGFIYRGPKLIREIKRDLPVR